MCVLSNDIALLIMEDHSVEAIPILANYYCTRNALSI